MVRHIRNMVITFIIGLAVLAALVCCAGLKQVCAIIVRVSMPRLLLTLALSCLTWVFLTLRLALFTRQAGSIISLAELFKMHISGYALNAILPAKLGDAALAGFLSMKGIPLGRSAAIVLQTRVLDIFAIICYTIPAFIMLAGREAPQWMTASLVICLAIVAVPIATLIIDRKMKLGDALEKLGAALKGKILRMAVMKVREAYCAYHDMMSDRHLLFFSVLLSLLLWLNYGLICCATAYAAGAEIPLAAGIGALAAANIGKGLAPVPGGTGIYEGVLAGMLTLFGMSFDLALVIAILTHFIPKAVTLLIGLPATAMLGFDIRTISQAQKPEGACSN